MTARPTFPVVPPPGRWPEGRRRRGLLTAVSFAAAVVGAAAFASPAPAADDKAFLELKARYEKAAKKHDDDGIRERRKLYLEAFDWRDQKGGHKLLHDALEAEDGLDARIALIEVLGATGDPKDLDLVLRSFAREKFRGPAIALGEGIACTAPEKAPAISAAALALVPKTKGDVRLSLLEGIGELGDPAAFDGLVALGDKWLPEEHCLRHLALGATGGARAVPLLAADAKVGGPLVQLGAVLGLARIKDPAALTPLSEALRSIDPRTQLAAAVALGAAKHRPAGEALADLVETAPLRVRLAARAALTEIVGKDHGLSAAAWRAALAGKAPPASEPVKLHEFFGIPVESDRFAIVLDLSRSMIWNDRLARAQGEITRFLGALDDAALFNVFSCSRTTERFAKTLVNGRASRDEAAAWAKKQLTGGGFDLVKTLGTILTEEPDVDTILLATDSLPWGESAADTAMEAIEIFRRANQFRRVRLEIAFVVPHGRYAASETEVDFEDRAFLLDLMAKTAGGKFVRIED